MSSSTAPSAASKNPQPNVKKLRLNYFTLAFQLRAATWLTGIGVFCFAMMGVILYLAIYRAAEGAPNAAAAKELVDKTLAPGLLITNYGVLLPLLILCIFLMAIGIVGTHKIAGPLFAIKRQMNRLRTGQTRGSLNLRRGDELTDVAGALNALSREWMARDEKALEQIRQAQTCAGSGQLAEALAALENAASLLEPPKMAAVQQVAPPGHEAAPPAHATPTPPPPPGSRKAA